MRADIALLHFATLAENGDGWRVGAPVAGAYA